MVSKSLRVLVILIGCLLVGCGPKGAADQSLAADIQARLASNDATRAANIKVAVVDGVVTLSGDVPSSDAALQAMTVANNTTGIKSVSNQMKVAVEASAVAPPSPPVTVAPGPPPPPAEPTPIPPVAREVREARPREPEHREPVTITIPAGSEISIRMIDSIDTSRNREGETFRASLSAPITDGDRVVVPVGAPAVVLLASARSAGRLKGNSELELRLSSIVYRGENVRVASGVYEAKGGSRGKQSAVRTGIGAAAGALIGGLAGGGKGAGIGAAQAGARVWDYSF